jgi:sulfide:quinone oxidoreductase
LERIDEHRLIASDAREIDYDLTMLLPAFSGAPAISRLGITNEDGYLNVDSKLKVTGAERMYAVGDCVNLPGPKLGHMAVRQATVAAANLAAEIEGKEPLVHYNHEAKMVIDATDGDTIYFHKDLASDETATIHQGRFWRWAKQVQERYWEARHV